LLAAGPEPRLRELLAQRRHLYAQAPVRVSASAPPEAVAAVVGAAFSRFVPPPVERLTIHTSTGRYEVVSGRNLLPELPALVAERLQSRRVFLVSDDGIWPLAGALLQGPLHAAGWQTGAHQIPHGEQSKTIAMADRVWSWLIEQGGERRDPVLAFGGGVVGDLAGFVAATYLRGVPFLQVPTTLLAQVDSSIGGKVAVDHPLAKNVIGAFQPAELVLVDTALLCSLPREQVANGWAEVLKHGVILDAELFDLMEAEAEGLLDLSPEITLSAVRRSLAIKARVVEEDEFEQGPRMLLNYGHTLGHAIEAATGYQRYLHGQAVSLGMVAAAWMAVRLGLLAEGDLVRIERALLRLELPIRADGLDSAAVLAASRRDKKVRQGQVTWVLPRRIGEAIRTSDVPPELAARALRYLETPADSAAVLAPTRP
jgi:3-dehydroquinate synthase